MYRVATLVILFLFSAAGLTADRYIKITMPVEQNIVDTTRPLLVYGTGRGVFEGNVVVHVEDLAGAQLIQIPATIIGVTMMTCAPSISEQERQYLKRLSEVVGFQLQNGALQLLDKDGQAVLGFSVVKPLTLVNTHWQALGINNGKGGVVSSATTGLATARFSDGRVSGQAGCNSFRASYVISDNQMTIGPAMATRMHCAEPEGIMAQEQEYLQALSRVRVYTLIDSRLQLRDEKGALQVDFVVSEE